MRGRCIANDYSFLTYDRIYDLEQDEVLDDKVFVLDDSDVMIHVPKALFAILSDDKFKDDNLPLHKIESLKKPLGVKYDGDKLDWTLLPFDMLEDVVKILMYGVKKYSRDNWKHVLPKERYLQASLRHLIQYQNGEKNDSETNLSHLAHCICCLLFLMWHDKNDSK